MKPGLYTVCDECQEPCRAELIKAVQNPEWDTSWENFHRKTLWLCPPCCRNMRRSEQGEPDEQPDRR